MKTSKNYRTLVLCLLTLVYAFNFIDRQILGILAPFIQEDLGLTNTQIGLLTGTLFAIFYTVVAIPIAWLADRYNRVVILSMSIAVWSGFTAITGFANNFLQIGLARMGVGVGEAGGSPPSHSIISDLYPKEERAKALGIYSLGIPFGIMFAYFVVAIVAGKSAAEVPWRQIFIVLGVVGIGLALIVMLVLREPTRGTMEAGSGKTDEAQQAPQRAPFIKSLSVLLTIPSWWMMALGTSFATFVGYSIFAFQTKYIFAMDPDFNLQTLMIVLGIIYGVGYAGGTFVGGLLANKWGKKDVRAYGWVPAIAVALAFPCGAAALWIDSVWVHLAFIALFLIFMGMYFGPSFAVAQTLAPVHMRAMSTALFLFVLNIISLGGGPAITGMLIDLFEPEHGTVLAIRFAFSIISVSILIAAGLFLYAAKHLPRDWAVAEERNEVAPALPE